MRSLKAFACAAMVAVFANTPAEARSSFTNPNCLDGATRSLLSNLEARFGKVALVKVCVPGARMPSGHVSWHARNKAFDFKVARGVDKRDVMVWLTKNSPGVTISYRGKLAGIIHTDTGSFHKVIYAAADHEAGHRAVAIWQERERLASLTTLPPKEEQPRKPPVPDVIMYADLDEELYASPPNIFQRYFLNKDVIVNPWVRTTCNGNKELPAGLHSMLRDASAHFNCPVYVNSMYRDYKYNRKVGGAKFSQHVQCKAVDFRVSCASPAAVRQWVDRRRKSYGVTFTKTYRSHVHADNGVRVKRRASAYAAKRKPTRHALAS